MNLIEIDQQVSDRLIEMTRATGGTRNDILRQILKIPILTNSFKNSSEKCAEITNADLIFRNIQDELIPYIIKVLYENGGRAIKSLVEQKIYTIFKNEFEKPYYQETVSHGVPRWKHNIAWSKERAKMKGFIKSAQESGRGIWELTNKGIAYCETNILK